MERVVNGIRHTMTDAGVADLKELSGLIGPIINYRTLAYRMTKPESFRLYELEAIAGALGTTVIDLLGGRK